MLFRLVTFTFFACMGYAVCIPKAPVYDCYGHRELANFLMMNGQGLGPSFTGDDSTVYQFFLNDTTREWTIIAIDQDINACVVVKGVNFTKPGEVSI